MGVLVANKWLHEYVSDFGADCKNKLQGQVGQAEASIRKPLDVLITSIGKQLGLNVVAFDEAADTERRVRPDYAVQVNGAVTGYVEVKAPGENLDPSAFKGHNLNQWNRLKDLPNLLYTNGIEWRLWRAGELIGDPVHLIGGTLATAGTKLSPGERFEGLLTDFLRWEPVDITSVKKLVTTIAPLTRLLRGEVMDTLAAEKRALSSPGGRLADQVFLGMAKEWKHLLFPGATDAEFADGYAQTVTFALLLAKSEGIDLDEKGLHDSASDLGESHGLMAKALQLLTDTVSKKFRITLDLMIRTINAVHWKSVHSGVSDMYLHLYEHFLAVYDNELRKQSGSYYTPAPVVEEMTRLTEEVLAGRLGKSLRLRDPDVRVIDPAMGTGTFPVHIMERAAAQAAAEIGPGAATEAINSIARRLYGFELQTGPYSVAELRLSDLIRAHGAKVPDNGLNLFVADTLEDPHVAVGQMSYMTQLIAQQRQRANHIKSTTNVTICIGNPPYKNNAEGKGGWVENGPAGSVGEGILADFRKEGNGALEYHLKNLYVYFWRWAFWKVFESTPPPGALDGDAGIICFITPSSFMSGAAFKGMREYIRRNCSEGWFIDCSPEGLRPPVNTRIFPGVQHPLAISIFVRKPDNNLEVPATLHYTSLHGRQSQKFQQLHDVAIDGSGWRLVRTDWTAPFTAAAAGDWDSYPAIDDLFKWITRGIKPNRNWVVAPNVETLNSRWLELISCDDRVRKEELFKKSRDSSLDKSKVPLFGNDVEQQTTKRFADEIRLEPTVVRVGHRSFDRQYVIADHRLMDTPRPDLWRARIPGQVFLFELHTKSLRSGLGVSFSGLVPSEDYFKGSEGGRVAAMYNPDGSPNATQGLLLAISSKLGKEVSVEDLMAYVACTVSHSSYTATFAEELQTPGVRVPLTKDPELWRQSVELGQEVLWLHTFGQVFADGRAKNVLSGSAYQVKYLSAVKQLDDEYSYDPVTQTLSFGGGSWGPLPPQVMEYNTGGKKTVNAWFSYRKKSPVGKKTSPLDGITATYWDADWSTELAELLTVLSHLVSLEPRQEELLSQIIAADHFTRSELEEVGVKWAKTRNDRTPGISLESAGADGTLF